MAVVSGSARVAAYIGVGIVSALIVAALKTGRPYGDLLICARRRRAARRAFCTGPSPWQAHDMAYHLLADMRIALFRKLDALAPGLSAAPPLRRSRRAGDAGRRNSRIFLRPYRRQRHQVAGAAAQQIAGRQRIELRNSAMPMSASR